MGDTVQSVAMAVVADNGVEVSYACDLLHAYEKLSSLSKQTIARLSK